MFAVLPIMEKLENRSGIIIWLKSNFTKINGIYK